MSIRAVTWALKDAPVPDPVAHLILIGLADHAADDGTNARPSQATLAEYANVSIRTVGYKIKRLAELGLIVRGDQQQVAHLRSDRRPTVWNLNLRMLKNDLQNLQAVAKTPDNDLQNLQTVQVMEDNDLQNLQAVAENDPYDLQPVADRSPERPAESADRADNGLQTVADRTVLLTTPKGVVVVNNSSGENGSHLGQPDGTTTNITVNGNSSDRDGVVGPLAPNSLRPHDVPGAWNPSPAAWAEAASAVELVNLRLHLARYRVVKKEQNKPCSNGEWLRWVIADETEEQKKARKEAQASRRERKWYSVAD